MTRLEISSQLNTPLATVKARIRRGLPALYAIDLLEGEEMLIFEEKLSRDDELRRVLDELREAAAVLAHTAPARLLPPDLEAKIAGGSPAEICGAPDRSRPWLPGRWQRRSPDKDYQLWLVDPAYQQPVDAGVFRVDEKGATTFTFQPKLRITSATAFAVSLERVSLTTWEMRARLRRLLGSAACLACWFLRPAETGSEQRLPQRRKFAMARRHSPSRETRALPKPRAARTQSHSSM